MKKLKISIIIGLVTLLISSTFSASAGGCKVTPNFSSDILVIEGQANPSEQISIMVFEDGIAPVNYLDKIPAENIKDTFAHGDNQSFETVVYDALGTVSFVDDLEADEKGDFSHEITPDGTGVYDVYLLYSDSETLKVIENIRFTSAEDYKSVIEQLNNGDKSAFITGLKNAETRTLLGFENELSDEVSAEAVAEIVYASTDNGSLKNDYAENLGLYKAAVAIASLNSGKGADISYLDYVVSKDENLVDFVEKYEDDEVEIINYLKNKEIKNTEELTTRVKEIAVLTIVKNPNGYENIKNAFVNFKDVTKISSPTSKNKVYSTLAGKEFDSIEELVSAYKVALSEEASNGGSSGGGGGGGGGSSAKIPGKSDLHTIEPSEGENELPETINKNIFDDLDSVAWAQEAVVSLAVNGVINGKSDKIFAPNDCITRAEFTKLVVAALANEEIPANISFMDVDSSNWAYPYIAKAKSAGIINGYSDYLFGATDLITRQDMSVIIYNAAKYKNIKLENADNVLTFADDENISDYAKEAVYTLRNMEIVNGTDTVHFEPKSYATRAQAAVMLYRLLLK